MFAARLNELTPYKPGEQPSDRVYIKLNANENAYPPPEAVAAAMTAFLSGHRERLARYADPDAVALKEAVASMLNATGGVFRNAENARAALKKPITRDMVFCGNGSDEVLSFVFYAFFDGDAPVVAPEHGYSFYPVYAGYYHIPLLRVPLRADFSLDTAAMLAPFAGGAACSADSGAASGHGASGCGASGMIFANPNAPTGIALGDAELRAMLAAYPKDKVFVVDEAYADFAEESALALLDEFPNLLVIRTFSKSLSFAGMRLGYAVGAPELVNALTTVKNSFNHFPVDCLCQTAGIAACREVAYYTGVCERIAETRDRFAAELRGAGYEVLPSQTNFVFARHPSKSGGEVYAAVKEAGILIRHFATPGIENFVRVTIGTEEEMSRLLAVMTGL